uniref:Polysaccharide biosynthesis protein CapD (PseB) n=2 Tax=environmental samples TaxID=651140 RepID=A0A075GY07_9ARCH|nr:Polysaccharide biosynthesis protein CapD (pseB) [uncultured marine thaumarchaeote KM3_199_D03]AIF07127.1 Polysaccharide biosynthesis protein CapD (pseB) [uncultured marine thaumarchaeote KM3_199_E03]
MRKVILPNLKSQHMFKNKKILITGGTGSLGTALTNRLLETDIDTIRIFSRDELKQSQMESDFNDDRLRFLIGDIRDKERLEKAVESIDIVIHTAALKQVPVIEYNPFEAIKTNVQGAQNLVEACLNKDVEFALAIGTDKAVSPFNTYGATKLLMERLFVSANYYKGYHKTKFSCVRYGNVLGSRGSILPVFVNQIISGKKITITDPNMTRFNITMDQALDLIFRVIKNSHGGDVYVPKLNAYRVGDIKDVLLDLMDSKIETVRIPVRIGEKYHEILINEHEIRNTYENQDNDYVIYENQLAKDSSITIPNVKKTSLSTEYSSDKVKITPKEELKEILIKQNLIPKKF